MPAEKEYAQYEQYALALIFWLNKFQKIVFDGKLVLYTDNKPRTAILGLKSATLFLAPARLQRLSSIMSPQLFF